MDFAKLNTRAAADKGAFCHFRHPATGLELNDDDGKAIGAFVRGTEAKTTVETVRTNAKRGLTGEAAGMSFAASLIISFQGVMNGTKAVEANEAGIKWLFDQSSAFEQQIIEFAQDRANFFGQASTV